MKESQKNSIQFEELAERMKINEMKLSMLSKMATKANTTATAEQILQDLDSSRIEIAGGVKDEVKQHFQEAFEDAMETLKNYGESIEVNKSILVGINFPVDFDQEV